MNQILKYPLSTEKSVKLMESENKILFVVDKKASKKEIKTAFEEMFKIKVLSVNTSIQKGLKKAYIKLPVENPAIDIATKLGIM
ncbi:50S ribosomal protein L23 [Candidatus Woesearchaeota archaeon]|nr:50S ribosomal protein L23 [Candidatus Woesearchaeota archaeon]